MVEQPNEEDVITVSKKVAATGSTMAKKPMFSSAAKPESESLIPNKVYQIESSRSPKAPSISESYQESSIQQNTIEDSQEHN